MATVSAEPIPHAPDPWQPDPARQRLADYTVEDVLALPDDAPRVELFDGVLHVVPSPSSNHQTLTALLTTWLYQRTPEHLTATQMVGVVTDFKNSLEPDVVVRSAAANGERHMFTADEVTLVVEVVSPSTRRNDRFRKPADYAAAGIRHYWRIEQNPVHVYAYDLGPDGHYVLVAESADRLEVDRPFPISLPIADITP